MSIRNELLEGILTATESNKPEPRNISAISIDTSSSQESRTISLAGTSDPSTSVNPSHIAFVDVPKQFSGTLTTSNNDGTITSNSQSAFLSITCMAIARFERGANVELGIGIGDPAVLPSKAGTSTDVLPLGTYISRFRVSVRGEGGSREVTLKAPYFPVGKTTNIGAQSGDKIFIVCWTEESSDTSVIFDDCILVVESFTSF